MKRTLLAFWVAFATHTVALAATAIYNLGEGTHDYGTGDSRNEIYDVALRIADPAFVGCRITGVRIWFTTVEGLSATRAWLSKELTVKSTKFTGADVETVDFEAVDGVNEISFSSPYTITDEGIYVGYSVLAAKDVNMAPIRLTDSGSDNGLFVHTSGLYRGRFYTFDGEKGALAIEVLLEGDILENAVRVDHVTSGYMLSGEPGRAEVEIINCGGNSVVSVDYTVSVGDDITETGHAQLAEPLPAICGRRTRMTVNVPAPSEQGLYNVAVRVDRVNTADNSLADAAASTTVKCYRELPTHRAVLEEYTGTWCGWCPRGFVALEEMNRLHPDDFIGISYHSHNNGSTTREPMEILAPSQFPWNSDQLGGWPGYPCGVLDRTAVCDPFFGFGGIGDMGIDDAWQMACSVIAPAAVEVQSQWTDENTLEAEALVTFPFDEDDVHYGLSFILTSDGLSGTTGDWIQVNNYRNYATPLPSSMDIFVKGDAYVSGLTFNDVFVGWSGRAPIDGSLPESVEGETAYSCKYAFDITAIPEQLISDKTKLRVNALLIDTRTTCIVNANKAWAGCSSLVKTDAISAAERDAKVAHVVCYDLQGRRTNRPLQGLYVETVSRPDGSVTTRKVVRK